MEPAQREATLSFYGRYIFPRLVDRALRGVGDLRTAALAPARGEVLEIGFGTGLNLPHYPAGVRSLAAVDPMDGLRERVEKRIAGVPFPVRRVMLLAEGRLPFEDAQFDCAVTTWTLCSIAEPLAALAEVRRVLRPDGKYLFLEHGLSDDARVARWQRLLTPLQRRIGCGCRLDRRIDDLVVSGGFELVTLRRFLRPGEPRLGAEMYEGTARPGAPGMSPGT